MTVHIKQLTGKMHVRGWTSGRSLTTCTKFYCNNAMLQLRLEFYFSHKTNQTYRKCHMHITFDCQQMLCSSLYYFAPLANMDNYDANVQIYDRAKCLKCS